MSNHDQDPAARTEVSPAPSESPVDPDTRIARSIEDARRTLATARRARRTALVIAGGGLALVAIGVGYWIAGPRVPTGVTIAAILGTVAAFGGAVLTVRVGVGEASRRLDAVLGLDDGAASAHGFSRLGDADRHGMHERQRDWLADRLEGRDASGLREALPTALLVAAIALPLLAVPLLLRADAAHIVEQREQAARTIALATELNEGIEALVEEEIAAAEDEAEKEALDPEGLKEMVERLAVSPETEDLLRQYAEMERTVAARSRELDAERAEQLLASAGRELRSGRSTQKLGQALERTDFDAAREALEAMKPSEDPPTAEDLAKKRAELEAFKEAAATLGEAARRFEAGSEKTASQKSASAKPNADRSPNAKPSNRPNANGERSPSEARDAKPMEGDPSNAQPSDGAQGEPSDQDPRSLEERIADAMRQLQQAAQDMEEAQGQCESGQCSSSDLDELARASNSARRAMSRLQRQMQELEGRRQARSRLARIGRALGQCQGAAAGQNQSPFSIPNPNAGGQRAGQGASNAENSTIAAEDGRLEQIQGMLGAGPSTTRTEDADDGSGAAARGNVEREVDHARQLESFVDRPDVPESVREGVKRYFEIVHGAADAAEGTSTENPTETDPDDEGSSTETPETP